jgi:Ni,Fe-hydrogenase maturation factor
MKLAERLGEKRIPKEVVIIGVMLKENPYIFGDELSPKIAAAVPKAVEMTLNEIKNNGKISS